MKDLIILMLDLMVNVISMSISMGGTRFRLKIPLRRISSLD